MNSALKTVQEERFAREMGERLRSARQALGINQAKLGKVMAASRGTVSHWECGRRVPTAYQVDLLDTFVKRAEKRKATR